MAKDQVAPIQIRLPPAVEARLRELAAERGTSLHSEVVGRLEASLAHEGEEPEITGLKVAMAALADCFRWFIPPQGAPGEHREFLLPLYRAAVGYFLGYMGAEEPRSPEDRTFADRAAKTVYGRIRVALDKKPHERSSEDEDLAKAGLALLPIRSERK